MRLLRAALVAALTLPASTTRAWAQGTPDEIARLDLVRQAQEARTAGDHARALDLATRAASLRPTPSLQLFIAQEHDRLGHPVEALAEASACARAAEVDASLRNREVILTTCGALVASLRERVGTVRVRIAEPPTDLTLRIAGAAVAPAARDLPRVVAPGAVEVAIDAPGYMPWRRTVQVTAGTTAEVPVTLVHAVEVVPTRGVGAGPYVLAGVGAASFGAAAVLYALSLGARDDRDAACTDRGCLPLARDHNARYEDLTLGTNVALGVGGALVVGGVIWWVVARVRGGAAHPHELQVAPQASAQGAGVLIGGAL